MRCDCCNVVLTPYEISMRSVMTGQFGNICRKCYSYIQDDVVLVGDNTLAHEDGIDLALYNSIEIEEDDY